MSNIPTTSIVYHPKNIINTPKDHIYGTGPEMCVNCRHHGSEHLPDGTLGRWLGYCSNCAAYIYKFHAGHGYNEGREETPENWVEWKDIDDIRHLLMSNPSWTKRCGYQTNDSVYNSDLCKYPTDSLLNLYNDSETFRGCEYYVYVSDEEP